MSCCTAAGDPRKQRHCAIGSQLYREWRTKAIAYAETCGLKYPKQHEIESARAAYDAAHHAYRAHIDYGWKPDEEDDHGTDGI